MGDWLDREGRFKFGKYGPSGPSKRHGTPVNEVAESDPSYLKWVIRSTDCDEKDKNIMIGWLKVKGIKVRYRAVDSSL